MNNLNARKKTDLINYLSMYVVKGTFRTVTIISEVIKVLLHGSSGCGAYFIFSFMDTKLQNVRFIDVISIVRAFGSTTEYSYPCVSLKIKIKKKVKIGNRRGFSMILREIQAMNN